MLTHLWACFLLLGFFSHQNNSTWKEAMSVSDEIVRVVYRVLPADTAHTKRLLIYLEFVHENISALVYRFGKH